MFWGFIDNPDITGPLIVVCVGIGLVITCLIGGERWPRL